MSGICGRVRWDGGEVEEAGVRKMMAAAEHRGPDGSGVWCGKGVGLGHLALKVTPESVGERQPLHDLEAGLVLVADARIDNRAELIGALSPRRVARNAERGADTDSSRSDSPSDAELILAAYRRWGTDCAGHLVGDFAFAVWEEKERQLFAARDPMGMRAFYYRLERGRLLFATEIAQILAVPGVEAKIFDRAVGAYLSGATGPPEWTLYEGIEQIAPAHAITVDAGGRRQWRYWDIDPEHRIRYRRDEEYVEHFRDVFRGAVRARLRSTGTVGMLLSGGMDSGSIVSTAGWLRREEGGELSSSNERTGSFPELRAYSYTFHELADSGERHISDPIAAHYDIPVTGVEADDAWPLAEFPAHGPVRDGPYISVYQPLYDRTYATAAAEGTRLVLTGDRGDEMVGDWIYDFPGLFMSGRWRSLAAEFRAYRGSARRSTRAFLKRELLRPIIDRLRGSPPIHHDRPGWLRSEFASRIGLSEIFEQNVPVAPTGGPVRDGRYRRIFRFGGARTAVWQERTTARLGVAWADPWADRRLAEFILAIPQHLVNRVGEPKRIARRAASTIMPEELLRSVSKVTPVGIYKRGLGEREIETVESLIADSRAAARGYIDADRVREGYQKYLRSGRLPQYYFWWPLTLEMWLRRYWDQDR